MSWIRHTKGGVFAYAPSLSPTSHSSFGAASSNFHKAPIPPPSSSGNKISPAVLIIIVILAVIFFISAFIDALPVFVYKEVVGPKEPFDCAVCLCEFSEKDKLRKQFEIEESTVEKATFPVRLGKFKKLNVGAEEGEGETSSSNLDARRCYSLGSYQYVVGDYNLMIDLSSEQSACNVKLAKLREQCATLSTEVVGSKKAVAVECPFTGNQIGSKNAVVVGLPLYWKPDIVASLDVI
ncbi:hypothetical protein HAX54_022952 [Datura stramonium]|uniref:Uncharacterized protein n=1 Tax=Datura stramonium TaxID=4076 RepID=A0ABS8UXT5_DATST|nr:hypothetical protein [Datura stramonium]